MLEPVEMVYYREIDNSTQFGDAALDGTEELLSHGDAGEIVQGFEYFASRRDGRREYRAYASYPDRRGLVFGVIVEGLAK